MGRKPDFKVSKAFTIGLQEAGFLAEKSASMGMKASQYINYLLRQEMLYQQQQEPPLPQAFCNKCSKTCPFDFNDKEKWVCVKCGDDRTDYIEDVIKYSSKFKRR